MFPCHPSRRPPTAVSSSLAQIVAEAQAAIDELFREQHLVQETIAHAQAYLLPIRRLSGELLRGLFLWCFEGHPCCAWVLSAVCADWRRKALRIPLIWSKSSSPDAIRLWLERSGPTVPLDIEIYLRVYLTHTLSPPGHLLVPPGSASPSNLHWGHIAVYYLVQQMHRWERFVFRFDRASGSAPLLKEFEVSSVPAVSYPTEWSRPRPSSSSQRRSCTLLTSAALPASLIPLDRILGIINANNGTLTSLRLHFSSVSRAVLPLPASTTLEHLEDLYVGGHHLLSQLVDMLTIPQLRALGLDLDEPREPIEETISRLYNALAEPAPQEPRGVEWYVAAGTVVSWAFLGNIGGTLEVLKVGGAAFESLIGTLAAPDDSGLIPGTQGQPTPAWACRRLRELYLRRCHTHAHAVHDGVGKLVKMVDARNPAGGGSANAGLELDDCGFQLGGDVVRWLEGRIGKGGLVCVEPPAEAGRR
ncbi:hypothetical protein B0H14DRAFT_2785230 [Mycena olivaceomarginata]|nr:hypothetical protein B0H14DRAFT_2785230 [Mycena olivaceomarginata]